MSLTNEEWAEFLEFWEQVDEVRIRREIEEVDFQLWELGK